MSEDRPQYCPRCGTDAPDHGAYCPNCGADLFGHVDDGDETVAQTPPQSSDDSGPGPSRRQFLLGGALIGSVAIGGAVMGWQEFLQSSPPQHAVYGEGWDVERSTGPQSARLEGEVTAPAGRYAARMFEPSASATYRVAFDVRSDGPIDLLFLESDEYGRYRDRDGDVQVLTDLSAFDSTEAALEGTVTPGEYAIVIDNTGVYGASPDGDAVVDLLITAEVA